MSYERSLSELFIDELDRLDVSDPFQRLQIELEKPGAARARRRRRIFMTRNRLVLLAAALVLIIGVSVFVGTRVNSSLHPVTTVPGGSSGKTTVAELLARPIQFQPIAAGQICPPDGPSTNGFGGAGPVYEGGDGGWSAVTVWGIYGSSFLLTPPGLVGPVVLRAIDLDNGQPLVHTGPYAAGTVVGTDTVDGVKVNLYSALAFDTDHPPKTTYAFGGSTYVQWPTRFGWPHTQTGYCTGIQIDGPSFTELLRSGVDPG